MSRIQTLTMVVELAEQRRDEALTEHARRVRELQMAQEQMDQLQGYVLEAQARWAQRGSQGIDVTLLLHHRRHLHLLPLLLQLVQFRTLILKIQLIPELLLLLRLQGLLLMLLRLPFDFNFFRLHSLMSPADGLKKFDFINFYCFNKRAAKEKEILTALKELIYHDEKYLAGWHQVK